MDDYLARRYVGPKLNVTVSREGHRVHRLIDDEPLRFRPNDCLVQRDPMVAALFGLPLAALRRAAWPGK
ncbi:hypothetical protein ASD15_23625 [Massilia sp. Root351]|jgi:hypothetical protein|uniref:hypothetical protein n=1 Tax=Massilia sp. Root351 TaxID=1736522 RepID=UPI00070EB76D|nr:hypothetical protein [Massilia sp. Root351]KQV90308.1 hypothetical protein ASD15_23625 [Massilia sp. Root351]